ncbi:MAG: SIMPL domain-containing protein, partial [Bacteroidetes bacterium]|nr:SIMPL domain-containing protein [Bacteroidota bacterium]
DKDIQTDQLSIEPRYRDGYRKEDFIGYFVRNTLAVTIADPKRLEAIVTEALDAGVNYIHGIDFQTTEYKKYREQAREMALLAAKEKAEKMAATLGQTIGRPLQISESYSGSPMGYWSGWGRGRAGGMSQNVMQNIPSDGGDITGSVALGKIAIRAGVSVTFQLTD